MAHRDLDDLILADGGADLEGFWSLDAEHGATDLAPNPHSVTLQGGINAGGASGPGDHSATAFDGLDDRIVTGLNPSGTCRTFEGCANRANALANHAIFASSLKRGPELRLASGGNDVNFWSDRTSVSDTWTNAWPGSAQWVHWMLLFDDTNNVATLVLNGVTIGSVVADVPFNADPGVFQIGAREGTEIFAGSQAFVAVYAGNYLSLAENHCNTMLSTFESRNPKPGLPSDSFFPDDEALPLGETLERR